MYTRVYMYSNDLVYSHSNEITQHLHFFFFFQAEDGIRDLTVTGVQTCALPIFLGSRQVPGPHRLAPQRGHLHSARHARSEEHTSELQSQSNLVCRLLLEKKNYDGYCDG